MNTIDTARLRLRPFSMDDAAAVAKMCNSYALYRNTLALPYPYTETDARQWISRHAENFSADTAYEFAVTDKSSGTLYGSVGIFLQPDRHSGELGYWLGEEHWGYGYAAEAAQAVINFVFLEKKLHRVFARHFGSNPASGRVMQKVGMTYEGTQREHIFKVDRYEDIVLYGILNPNVSSRVSEHIGSSQN